MILKKPLLILISGRAGVGKTKSSGILEKIIKESYKSLAPVSTFHFAHGVKKAAKRGFSWNGEKDDRGRKLLQQVGAVGREYWKYIWVEQCLLEIKNKILDNKLTTALLDDWRFPNEYIWLARTNWNLFSIRVSASKREILKGMSSYNDISEISLSEKNYYYDYLINNSGDLNALKGSLNDIIYEISNEISYFGEESNG